MPERHGSFGAGTSIAHQPAASGNPPFTPPPYTGVVSPSGLLTTVQGGIGSEWTYTDALKEWVAVEGEAVRIYFTDLTYQVRIGNTVAESGTYTVVG